jgi:hypothetical protein
MHVRAQIGEDSDVPRETEPAAGTIVIEGSEWSLEDATEFARRIRRYLGASSSQVVMHAATSLAERLDHFVEIGGVGIGGSLDLTLNEAKVASAVLDEWRQSSTRPDAVDTLYRLLAAP